MPGTNSAEEIVKAAFSCQGIDVDNGLPKGDLAHVLEGGNGRDMPARFVAAQKSEVAHAIALHLRGSGENRMPDHAVLVELFENAKTVEGLAQSVDIVLQNAR